MHCFISALVPFALLNIGVFLFWYCAVWRCPFLKLYYLILHHLLLHYFIMLHYINVGLLIIALRISHYFNVALSCNNSVFHFFMLRYLMLLFLAEQYIDVAMSVLHFLVWHRLIFNFSRGFLVIPEVALGDVCTHHKSWHICFLAFFVMPKRKAKNPFGLDWVTLIAKLKK